MSGNRKMPVRKCVGCQEMKNKKEMIRIIRTAENEFVLDTTGKRTDGERIFAQTESV